MANLQVKDIDENLYKALKRKAQQDRRSVSQEVVMILEKYLSSPELFQANPTREFLQMAGSWADERSAQEIIADIRATRSNSSRFERDHELFD